MRWSLDDVPVFVAIVRHGGITAAANVLGRPKSTVSIALSRLEEAVGVKLLHRTSRTVQLTAEGEQFYERCLGILEQADATDALITGLSQTPAGRLSVALPSAFCREIVAPALSGFIARYPEIEVDLATVQQGAVLDLSRFDIAVIVGELADTTMTRKVLLQGRLIWVAAPEYAAANSLESLEQLLPHIKACERRYGRNRIELRHARHSLALDIPRTAVRFDDPLTLRSFVENGGGISFLPERYCHDAIASGRLVQIVPDIAFVESASVLSVVFPTRNLLSPRIRVFIDFLSDLCRTIQQRRPE